MSGMTEDQRARLERLIAAVENQWGRNEAPFFVAKAPGRVNLIGEHTDYNDGFVMPIAIEREILVVGRARSDRQVRLLSLDFSQSNEFSLDEIAFDTEMGWSNYLRGVFSVLQNEGHQLMGVELAVAGNVPLGSGLSSSAALEVATISLLDALHGLGLSGVVKAKLAQRAENEFVGVQCGIMDQFISCLGQKDHALRIDCRSLEYQQIKWPDQTMRILIADTRQQRGLVDSEYNRRRQECEAGVEILSQVLPGITALRDVSAEQFETHSHLLTSVIRARCAHVVYENERVMAAAAALQSGDWPTLGRLFYESHASLRDLYQVSCPALDAMVEIARSVEGVYGARMTGAGFGGCAIALVQEDAQEELARTIERRYPQLMGRAPQLLQTGVADGACSGPWEEWR